MAMIGHPIIGDNKYGGDKDLAGGIEPKLHLHARRLVLPHPVPGEPKIDVTAPLPEHMRRTWELLGLDADRYDGRDQ
jgi:23S rRNA pseudouridine955/2504/2580 synthase